MPTKRPHAIARGRAPSREATLAGVAHACRLSVATVSLALNRNPRVTGATQQRVRAMAQKLGYVPNPTARRLALSRFGKGDRPSDQVGFVVISGAERRLDQPYLGMLTGADREIARHGGNLVFFHCEGARGMERLMGVVRHGSVDGWLVLGLVDESVRRFLVGLGRPFVVIGEHSCRRPVCSVTVDYRATGALAARELAALGHRRVGYLGATMRFAYQREMRDGFLQAAREFGLDDEPGLVQTGERSAGGPSGWQVSPLLDTLLAMRKRPTAFVASEPWSGSIVLSLLRQYEFEVPRQASLIACDWNTSTEAAVGLSLAELPIEEVGTTAIALLRDQGMHPRGALRQVRVSPRFRPGWSLAPLRPDPRTRKVAADAPEGHA